MPVSRIARSLAGALLVCGSALADDNPKPVVVTNTTTNPVPTTLQGPVTVQGTVGPEPSTPIGPPTPQAPAPPPLNVFEGLDRFNWGAGSPPDTNGDVGPNNYIETVNTSIGVYRKSDGFQQAA